MSDDARASTAGDEHCRGGTVRSVCTSTDDYRFISAGVARQFGSGVAVSVARSRVELDALK